MAAVRHLVQGHPKAGISFIQKFCRDPPERGRQTRVGWRKQAFIFCLYGE